MLDILIKAGCFIAIIILGYTLKKIGVFKDSDFSVLSTITLKLTLPAAIISNFANKELDPSLFTLTLLALMCGGIYMLLGYLLNLRTGKDQQAFEILNLPGYNIGCFALPFVQNFLGPLGVISCCLFDIGNGFVCLGGAFSIASALKDGGKISFKRIVRTLSKSVPFLCFLIMPTLCLLHVRVPKPITSLAEIIGNANAFTAMLMLGVGFKLTAERHQLGRIFRVLSIRFLVAAILGVCFYTLLPFSPEVRKSLVILVFSPIGSAVPAFTGEMKSDVGLSSAINSISIICSIIIIVCLLLILP